MERKTCDANLMVLDGEKDKTTLRLLEKGLFTWKELVKTN